MYKNIWLAMISMFILVFALMACSSAPAPTQEPAPTSPPEPVVESTSTTPPTTAPLITEQPTEAVLSGAEPYPAPTIEYFYDPYPAPVDGEVIEWSELEAFLNTEQVAEVFQQYSLQIVITTTDGRIFLVIAPAKDEIFKMLDSCGQKCNRIRRISEF